MPFTTIDTCRMTRPSSSGSSLASLYRHSRLVSLPQPTECSSHKQPFPTEQVICSTPASFHRRDFGLKQVLPRKYNAHYITVKRLDTNTGIVDFERGSMAFGLKKIKELPGTVVPIRSADADGTTYSSFFRGSTGHNNRLRRTGSSRESFKEWLKTQNESVKTLHNSYERKRVLINKFFKMSSDQDHRPQLHNKHSTDGDSSCVATAGLRYALPGTLQNTPKGPTTTHPVQGRILQRNGVTAAVSGVIARSEIAFFISDPSPYPFHKTQPLQIHRMSVSDTGGIDITVRQPTNRGRVSLNLINRVRINEKTAQELDALYKKINDALYS